MPKKKRISKTFRNNYNLRAFIERLKEKYLMEQKPVKKEIIKKPSTQHKKPFNKSTSLLKYTSKKVPQPKIDKSLFEKICKGSIIKKNNQTFIAMDVSAVLNQKRDNSYYLDKTKKKNAKLILNKSNKSIIINKIKNNNVSYVRIGKEHGKLRRRINFS